MPLRPGFTSFHGVVMCGIHADEWRRTERRIRRYIDRGHENAASYWLSQCDSMAGDDEEQERLAAYMRRDAANRWFRTWAKQPGFYAGSPIPGGPAGLSSAS